MADTDAGLVDIFYSYAPEDEPLQQELATALGLLRRQGRINEWSSRNILGGDEWQQMTMAHLEAAHVILLLISNNFINSDQCYKVELPRALELQEAGTRVIPILLSPVAGWEKTRFATLQPLPRNGRAVTSRLNTEEAFTEIASEIHAAIEQVASSTSFPVVGASRRDRASPSGVHNTHNGGPRFWSMPYQRNPFFTGRDAQAGPQRIEGRQGDGGDAAAGLQRAGRYWQDATCCGVRLSLPRRLPGGPVGAGRLARGAGLRLHGHRALAEPACAECTEPGPHRGGRHPLAGDPRGLAADPRQCRRSHYRARYAPRQARSGHILITTRATAMGRIADLVEIDTLPQEEATLFLLRRAGIIGRNAAASKAPSNAYTQAKEIAEALDGLPLALEQAGAYIEETRCGLAGYLDRYHKRQGELLHWLGTLTNDYPRPVATTWELSFQRVEEANPTAARILCFCAFLHPDEIPEELLLEDLSDKKPPLEPLVADEFELDVASAELRKYSIVKRDPTTKMLSIHRLVQVALTSRMDADTQRHWVERVVWTLAYILPDVRDYTTWPHCERYILHAQACLELTSRWDLAIQEASFLFNQSGYYLRERGQYTQALPLLQRALAIRERVLGPEHPDTAISLNNLASLYNDQGNTEEAVPLYQRALAIRERMLGPEHPTTATSLNNLALLYANQGNTEEALPLYQRALAILEKALGPDHPTTIILRNNYTRLQQAIQNQNSADPEEDPQ